MGKRKSSSKPIAKAKMAPLDKQFKCLFCQHTGTVTCKIDNKKQQGRLDCKDCGQHFSCDTNHLTEAIDIYSEWIDACKDVNPDDASSSPSRSPSPQAAPSGGSGRLKKRAADQDAEEDEEDLPDFRRRKDTGGEVLDEEEEEEDLPDPKRRKQTVVEDDEEDE